jgi:hypothetical protein
MEQYIKTIDIINESISEFNNFLSIDFQIEILDKNKINDNDYFLDLKNKKWGDYSFPKSREYPGVYFYFGFNIKNSNDICVYIGKASFSSTTGKRLWSHFKNKEQINIDETTYYKNGDYAVEMICIIPFKDHDMGFFSSSLEEFLIQKLSNRNHLLFNSIGNY